MIKNIILDVGGVIFDDSKQNLSKLLNKNCDQIYKTVYGQGFRECLLGRQTITELIKDLRGEPDFEDLKFILTKENLYKSYPIMQENYEYVKSLKARGYKLYLLTNITEESYYYIDKVMGIDSIFDGGIYSYQEHIKKPDEKIYKLILEKYRLNPEETIFFDDREKNIVGANKSGLPAILFKGIETIENYLKEN